MAFRQPFCCFFLLLLPFHLIPAAASTQYLLPIVKDELKPQYYTSFLVGTPPLRVYVSIDLANQFSWFTCDIVGYNRSSSYGVVDCDSQQCSSYGGSGCVGCNGPIMPSCNNNSCGAYAYTPWSDGLYSGGLIDDTISIYRLSQNSAPSKASLKKFPFTCADKGPLKGLSGHTKGVVTLARTPVALHAQISSTLKAPRKFSLCVPSSSASGVNGAVYFGGGPYILPPSRVDLSKSLVTTALVVNRHSTAPIYTEGEASIEYFIKLRSIKIDGTPLRFNSSLLAFDKEGNGGTKISTLAPYSALHSQIYKPFVDLFVSKAAALKVAKVASVAPFGACFSSKSIYYNAKTGRGLPVIDLVMNEKSALLHGKNARWRIYGSNSMVKVSRDVECLGFVDGGNAMTPIVIGGKQLEDNLVEFDLEGNKLGFTSSLLRMGTSCSQFRGV